MRSLVRGQQPFSPLSVGQHLELGPQQTFWPVVPSQHDDSGPQMFLSQQVLRGLAHRPVPQQVAPGAHTMLPQQID